jgi:hypothetical protein
MRVANRDFAFDLPCVIHKISFSSFFYSDENIFMDQHVGGSSI